MKTTVIAKNNYRGIRSWAGEPNKLTAVFYGAKFHRSKRDLRLLTKLALKEIKQNVPLDDVCCLTAVNTVLSKWNLPKAMAQALAEKLDKPYRELFKDANQHLAVTPKRLKGKTVLVIDDVIYSGSTLSRVRYLLRQAGAKQMYYYVPLKSPKAKIK